MSKKIIFYTVLSISFIALLFLDYTFFVIYQNVKSECLKAQAIYRVDCTESLISIIQSDKHSFKEKNTAVWALGQLADKRALPVLRSFYTGAVAPKESTGQSLSQYELRKAIGWCERGNVTSWMYRNRADWR